MNMTKEKKNRFILLGLFMTVILIYHLLMREYTGDTVIWFSKFLNDGTLGEVLAMRYETWTSRLLIEAVENLLAHNYHIILWAVFNIIMYLLLALSLMYLTHHANDRLLLGMLLIYPVIEMGSAGWLPTYINYLWPLATACVAMIALDKMYYQKKIYLIEGIVYLLFELFATNFETLAAGYLGILIWYAFHFCFKRRPSAKEIIYWLAQVTISVGNIIYALTCPGNWVRKTEEVTRWLKEYPSWSFADKIIMGVNTTVKSLTDSNILFFIFVVIIFGACCIQKEKRIEEKIIAAIPLFFTMTRTLLKPVVAIYYPTYNAVFDYIEKVNGTNYYRASLYFPFIVYGVILIAITVTLFNLFDDMKDSLEFVVIFLMGLATRIVMGFSPTLYASEKRTFMFLNAALIFIAVEIYAKVEVRVRKHPVIYKVAKCLFASLTVIAIVGNMISIHTQ